MGDWRSWGCESDSSPTPTSPRRVTTCRGRHMTRWPAAMSSGTDNVIAFANRAAAGGITTQKEVDDLHALGVDAVVGMAIYTGRLTVNREP